METSEYVSGYVVGEDSTPDGSIWKVRVTDRKSQFCNQKLVVASVHNNISLSKGLNVSFLVGIFSAHGEDYHKAVDVRLSPARVKCMFCDNDAHLAFEVSGDQSQSAQYVYVCLYNIPAALSMVKTIKVAGIKKVLCLNFKAKDSSWERLHL